MTHWHHTMVDRPETNGPAYVTGWTISGWPCSEQLSPFGFLGFDDRWAALVGHRALPYAETPQFMPKLAAANGTAAVALRFVIFTVCRTNDVLGVLAGPRSIGHAQFGRSRVSG